MQTEWIELDRAGERRFDGYLALPPAGRGPGLVLIQEIWGVNDHIRALAELYALAGFVVLAPDVFWRLAPRAALDYDQTGSARAFELAGKLDGAQAADDMVVALDVLRGLPQIDGGTGMLGYCLGGQLAFRAGALGGANAIVSYYGGGIERHLDLAPRIAAPAMFHYALQDAHITADKVAQVQQAFADRPDATFHLYPGVQHGFNCWGRQAFDRKSSQLALSRTLAFLSQTL